MAQATVASVQAILDTTAQGRGVRIVRVVRVSTTASASLHADQLQRLDHGLLVVRRSLPKEMNDTQYSTLKVLVANISSWVATGTAVKLTDISLIVGIMAGVGSLCVSIYSVRWIKQQMLALSAKKDDAPRS